MFKACIFDLDGTLANTLDSIAWFGNSALAERGLPPVEKEEFRHLVGNGADNLMRGLLKTAGSDGSPKDTAELRQCFDRLYAADPLHLLTDYEGIPELLKRLRANGTRLAVVSNKPHELTRLVVEGLFPAGTFDLYVGQRPGVERKPSPEGVLLAAKELEVNPEECLYIGDSDVDMMTGANAGMKTIGVLWGFRGRRELEESGACWLVSSAEEIYRIVTK